uniref:Putative secreted protein n=1 Tax=Ixodes ricinus TaxID=34613 RepID=A0A6B0U923_IXORI
MRRPKWTMVAVGMLWHSSARQRRALLRSTEFRSSAPRSSTTTSYTLANSAWWSGPSIRMSSFSDSRAVCRFSATSSALGPPSDDSSG